MNNNPTSRFAGYSSLSELPAGQLVRRLKELVAHQSVITANLLAHLGEVDARKLYLGAACSSMFVYCVEVLGLSEGATYKRLHAARAAAVISDLCSSTTTSIRGAWAGAARLATSDSSVVLTTVTWPSETTAQRWSGGTSAEAGRT